MRRLLLMPLLAAVLFSASGTALAAGGSASSANRYFGHILAPCANPANGFAECRLFTARVKCAAGVPGTCISSTETPCTTIDADCAVGREILKSLYGNDTYRDTLPDFIVYADDWKEGTTITLTAHDPLLMWNGENTPHLMGARAIYVIVLAHNKLANITAHVTSDSTFEPNPLVGLLGTIKAPAVEQSDSDTKRTQQNNGTFAWHDLTGGNRNAVTSNDTRKREDQLVTWAGIARIEVPDSSINRVTVAYDTPPATTTGNANGKTAEKPPATTTGNADGKTAEKPPATTTGNADGKTAGKTSAAPPTPTAEADTATETYRGDFLAETGHFSNSPASHTAISFALGTTFNSQNTSIASGGSNVSVDGFMFAKIYICRPHLYALPHQIRRYSPSLGLVLGTNVNGGVFNDIVLGISVGHLIGNVGVVAGVNSIAGKPDTTQGRKNRLMLGLEYTF